MELGSVNYEDGLETSKLYTKYMHSRCNHAISQIALHSGKRNSDSLIWKWDFNWSALESIYI